MKALVSLLETYRPGISATFKPADESDIELLEETAGPLPGAYLRFLRMMGSGTGDLELDDGQADLGSMENSWSVYDILDWLKDAKHSRYLYIGQDNSPNNMDYFLDRAAPQGKDDCMVVRMPLIDSFDPEHRDRAHASLEEFLFHEAFRTIRLPLLAHHRRFRQPYHTRRPQHCQASAVSALAEEQGFRRIPPATRCALYERDNAALLLSQRLEDEEFEFLLSGDENTELDRLARLFVEKVGVEEDPDYSSPVDDDADDDADDE